MLRPKDVRSLMDSMSATVGTPAKAILDREMTPILAELMTLKNKNHSAFEQLFKWLVDPQRTGEEFYYIIGPLRQHVAKIMEEHFRQYVFNVDCLIKVAMEALAVKCPTLEGPWELAAWTLVSESELYYKVWELEIELFTKEDFAQEDFGPVSHHFSNWIICVIGDPDLCPNSYLRIELVSLLLLVDLGLHNWTHAFESLLTAFNSINLDYLHDSKSESGYFGSGCLHQVDLYNIRRAFEKFSEKEYLLEYDEKLSENLLGVKTARVSSIVHDIAYNSVSNPNKYAQPMALKCLTALLKIIDEIAKVNYKAFREESMSNVSISRNIVEAGEMLCVLMNPLKKSCQTPQLVDLTTSCIIGVMELHIFLMDNEDCLYALDEIDMLVDKLFDEKDVPHMANSPVVLEMNLKYIDRIRHIRGVFYANNSSNDFSRIRVMLDIAGMHDFRT